MNPVPVGTPIRIGFVPLCRDYDPDLDYLVAVVDPSDGTLRAACPSTGKLGDWVSWSVCTLSPLAIGWPVLQTLLSPEALSLLECFSGLDSLTLASDMADRILLNQPDLAEQLRDLADEERESDASSRPIPRARPKAPQPLPARGAVPVGGRNSPFLLPDEPLTDLEQLLECAKASGDAT